MTWRGLVILLELFAESNGRKDCRLGEFAFRFSISPAFNLKYKKGRSCKQLLEKNSDFYEISSISYTSNCEIHFLPLPLIFFRQCVDINSSNGPQYLSDGVSEMKIYLQKYGFEEIKCDGVETSALTKIWAKVVNHRFQQSPIRD